MGEMLLFWLVYGIWMVFVWGGVLLIVLTLLGKLASEITHGDYNLNMCIKMVGNIFGYNTVTKVLTLIGLTVQFIYAVAFIKSGGKCLSHHNIATGVSEWSSTTLQTPLLIALAIVGVMVLLKKGYPLFKKIKILADTLNKEK